MEGLRDNIAMDLWNIVVDVTINLLLYKKIIAKF